MPTPARGPARPAAPVLALLAALLLPAAPARALTVTLSTPDEDDAYVSRAECLDRSSEAVTISWDLDDASGSEVEILASSSSGCTEDDDDVTTAVLEDGIGTSTTSYDDLTVEEILSAAGKEDRVYDADDNECQASDFSAYVCVKLLDSSGDVQATGTAALKFQLKLPPAPTAVAVTPGEEALYVSWTEGTATSSASASSETYRAYAQCTSDSVSDGTCSDASVHSSGETSDTSVRIGGLSNGATYTVWAVAYSKAGNESAASETTTGTPVPVDDYYEHYRDAGGREAGGCAGGPAGGPSLLLGLLGLLGLRRGRRGGWGRWALLACLAAAAPAPARADWSDWKELAGGPDLDDGPVAMAPQDARPSPRRGSLELSLGTFRPDVDSEFGGSAHPFRDVFGSGNHILYRLGGAAVLWDGGLLRLEGGLRAGWVRLRGHGLLEDGSASEDETTFTVVPLDATLTGRLDLRRAHLPVEPYLRLGLERYCWWVTGGDGGTTRRGATDGWSAAAGLALSFALLDPEAIRLLDRDDGVNDLALFVEVAHTQVDDFGSSSSWRLSDRGLAWSGGLLVVF